MTVTDKQSEKPLDDAECLEPIPSLDGMPKETRDALRSLAQKLGRDLAQEELRREAAR